MKLARDRRTCELAIHYAELADVVHADAIHRLSLAATMQAGI